MLLKDLLDLWVEKDLRNSNLSNSTVDSYIRIANRIKKHYIGNYEIASISTNVLQRYMDLLSLGGEDADGRIYQGYSKDYVNMFLAVLNHCFSFLVYPEGVLSYNPMQYVVVHKKRVEPVLFGDISLSTQKHKTISQSEYRTIIDYLDSHKRRPSILPVQIAYYTGLRLGEVCALCWEDISLNERYICVRRSMRRNTELGEMEIGPTKNSRARLVDFGDSLYEILTSRHEKQQNIRSHRKDSYKRVFAEKIHKNNRHYFCLRTYDRSYIYVDSTDSDDVELDLVCTRDTGMYMIPDAIADACRAVSQSIPGLEGFHFHSLRHTYTSNLLALGAPPKDVQELLGHSDMRTTMNIYAHSRREDRQRTVRLLDNI